MVQRAWSITESGYGKLSRKYNFWYGTLWGYWIFFWYGTLTEIQISNPIARGGGPFIGTGRLLGNWVP